MIIPLPTLKKSCLALDLATLTGHAYNPGGEHGPMDIGTWELCNDARMKQARLQRWNRRRDPRVTVLASTLAGIVPAPEIVVFEDVEFSKYTLQCQLWASLRAAVWLAWPVARPFIDCVNVSTLKKFATGHGGATKEGMARALLKKYPGTFESRFGDTYFNNGVSGAQAIDDNAIDAVWLWLWAQQRLSRI